jgi:hypothetical protein
MSRFSFNNIVLVGLAIFVSIILITPTYAVAIGHGKSGQSEGSCLAVLSTGNTYEKQ